MSSDERIFNLQLTIQKLEEELTLYRNGTSAQQLLDLLKDNDVENGLLKEKVKEKTEKLKQLAKSSTEFLQKHQKLQKDKDEISDKLKRNIQQLSANEIKLNEANSVIQKQNENIISLKENNEFNSKSITKMKLELIERCVDIEKLQNRCALLVSEKSDVMKSMKRQKANSIVVVNEFRVSY